jgi:hypothetical protein
LHLIADSPSFISVDLLFALLKLARSKGILFSQILDSQDKEGLTAFTYCLNSQKDLEWRMKLMFQLLRNGANPFAGKVNNPVLAFTERELKYISSCSNLNLIFQEMDRMTKAFEARLSVSPMRDLIQESIMAPKVAPPAMGDCKGENRDSPPSFRASGSAERRINKKQFSLYSAGIACHFGF